RCSKKAVVCEYVGLCVQCDRHRVVVLRKERLHVLCAPVIDGNRENTDVLSLKICEGPLHGGHLFLTDRSPCRPESQYCHVANQIGGAYHAAVKTGEAESRHCFAFLEGCQPGRRGALASAFLYSATSAQYTK